MTCFGEVAGLKPRHTAQFKPLHAAGWLRVAGQDFLATAAATRCNS